MDNADRAKQGRRILKNITMDAAALFFMGLSITRGEDENGRTQGAARLCYDLNAKYHT